MTQFAYEHLRPTVQRERDAPQQADNNRELSNSQDRAAAMKTHYKERAKQEKADTKNADRPTHEPQQKTQSNNSRDLSDKQDQATQMLNRYRQLMAGQQERQRKAWEMHQQATQQTKKQEVQPSITDQAAEMLERYRQRNRDRGHDDLEYKIIIRVEFKLLTVY